MSLQTVNLDKLLEAEAAADAALEAATLAAQKIAEAKGAMPEQTPDLDKLAEAQEAADTALDAATLAAEKIAVALLVTEPEKPRTVPLTFRATFDMHEQLQKLAADTSEPIQKILVDAVSRYLDAAT